MSEEMKNDVSAVIEVPENEIQENSEVPEGLSMTEEHRLSPEDNKKFCREMNNVCFSELLCKLMHDNKINIKELSKASGISLWKLKNIMDGDGRTTLKNMSDLLWVFGYELDLNIKKSDFEHCGWGPLA